MKAKQALRIAIKELERRKQHLAVDANAHDIFGFDNPQALTASEERRKISEAIVALKEIEIISPDTRHGG